MGLLSPSAELRALGLALEGLQSRVTQHHQDQQARRAVLIAQLQALEPLLVPSDSSSDPREQLLGRLRQALEPADQSLEGWRDAVYAPKLAALLKAEPGWAEQVEFTMVRCADQAAAAALLPALRDGEAPPEAGLVGPRRLRSLTAELRAALEPLQPGEVQGPLPLGPWWLLLRLEQRSAATVTADRRLALQQEMFDEDLTALQLGEAPRHAPELAALLTPAP